MTAAAGHARDYIAGTGATDGETDGATHPGTGEDAYWQEGESYTNGQGPTSTVWPGAPDGTERTTAQHLSQDRAPIDLEEWAALPNEEKIGDFWVIDHETGWAYWASQLQEGESSSYLLDAAEMTEAAHDIRGSYYYAIHVDSQLITPDRDFENEPESGEVGRLLRGIRNNAVDDNGGLPAENPDADEPSPISAFNFESMNPGRLFTTSDGQQFRYLEDMGEGNHLIIRNSPMTNVSHINLNGQLNTWFAEEVTEDLKAMVQPVSNNFTVGVVARAALTFEGEQGWLPNNLTGDVAADETRIVQGAGGSPQAFVLSLADVTRLSGTGRGFANLAQRGAGQGWWLRTRSDSQIPGPGRFAWRINEAGQVAAEPESFNTHGARPALIIHQAKE